MKLTHAAGLIMIIVILIDLQDYSKADHIDNEVDDNDDSKDASSDFEGDGRRRPNREEFAGLGGLFGVSGLSIDHDVSWSHEEQVTWGNRYPACDGPLQSPIALNLDESTIRENSRCLHWLNYHSEHEYLVLNNTGHTIDASISNPTEIPMLSGGPLRGDYQFYSVHWHWGEGRTKGAEHVVDSKESPMEMHFIHFNKKFGTITKAITSGERDALAVVGVLFKLSDKSIPGMSIITKAIKYARRQGVQQGFVLPLGDLGLNFKDGYYTYSGSLTTPNCFPIVRWIVLKRRAPIRNRQIEVFRNVLVNNEPLVNNYRYVQPRNGRRIRYFQNCQS